MKKNKIISLALAGLMVASTVGTMAGCTKKKFGNGDQDLEVYIRKGGHGTEWLDQALKAFGEKEETKAKYPNYQYKLQINSEDGFGMTQIESGGTTLDLVVGGTYSPANAMKEYKKGQLYLENLQSIYDSKIPLYDGSNEYEKNADGEYWTYGSKMQAANPTIYDSFTMEDADGNEARYTTTTAAGKYGIVYNKTMMDKYGYKDEQTGETILPRTTNELIALCEAIKAQNEGKEKGQYYAFISSKETSYWAQGIAKTFWAQYSGYEGYANYFQGLWENENGEFEVSVNVVDDMGKRESLRVVDKVLNYRNGYIHPDSAELGFTRAQALLLDGTALMQANGDWISEELEFLRDDDTPEEALNNEIRFMNDPVISALANKLDSVETDEEFSAVIGAIQAGQTALQGEYKVPDYSGATATWKTVSYDVSQADYDRIVEAMSLYSTGTSAGGVVIPSYATAKEVAKDFLLYLASDENLARYTRLTNGSGTAFYYDVQTKDPTAYATFHKIQKDRIAMTMGKRSLLPAMTCNYKLVYLGGFYSSAIHEMEPNFKTKNNLQYKSADQLCDEVVELYTKNDNTNWNYMLMQAGLN